MKIFEYAKSHPEDILAVTDDGERIPYAQMLFLAEKLRDLVGHRLVFLLCRNTPGSLLGYLALLQSGGVPLLLDDGIAPGLLRELAACYRPAFCLLPEDLPEAARTALEEAWNRTFPARTQGRGEEGIAPGRTSGARPLEEVLAVRDYRLVRFAPAGQDPPLAPALRLLLETSGSTGSSKLVRISARNLDANAASIIEYLQITKQERPITVLPMQYSYGMSILHTHVMAGAPILLTAHTLLEKSFWDRVRREGATSLCGVPYTFEIYDRVGLMQMPLPSLRTITQAGGKLQEAQHRKYALWCAQRGIRFCVMYGQTEACPRMGWLPPEKAVEKCGSMGIAIPGGRLSLIDDDGNAIPAQGQASLGPVGELVYEGPNVSLGYAECARDLLKGDEFRGVLRTGDLARRDADGYFYIVGRRSRFIKVAGKRIGLDEAEKILRTAFPAQDIACAGRDEELCVYIAAADIASETAVPELAAQIRACLQSMAAIPEKNIHICPLREIPRSSAGKVRYAALPRGAGQPAAYRSTS